VLPPPPISIRLWSRPSVVTPGSTDIYCTVTKSKNFPAGDDSGPRVDVWWGYWEPAVGDPTGVAQRSRWHRGEYCWPMRSPASWIGGTHIHRGVEMGPGESMTYLIEPLAGLTGECDVRVCVTFHREMGEPIVGKARMPIDFPSPGVSVDAPRSRLRAETR